MKLCVKNMAKVSLLSTAIALVGCSGTDSLIGGSSDGLVISGSLSGASLMTLNQKLSTNSDGGMNAYAVDFEDLEIVAVAATEPPTVAEADVNADGTFSVDLGEEAKGTAVTITFVNEETDAVVGEVKFTDDSTTDLNGNPKAESAVVAKDDLNLGAITLSEDGTISVEKDEVANVEVAPAVTAASSFDPTGEWTMSAVEGSLPTGFETVDNNCSEGPCIGFPVTLARFAGKEFTPDNGNCVKDASGTIVSCPVASGTVGSADRFALSIWGGNYGDSIGACGGRTGFSADEARGYGRIHLTSLPSVSAGIGVSFGAYIFSTAPGFGGDSAPYNQPWMATSATAMHDEFDCRPMTISGTTRLYNAWACKSEVRTGMWPGTPVSGGAYLGWNIGTQGGGCFDANTLKPIDVRDWSTIGIPSSHTTVPATAYGAGFYEHRSLYNNVDPDGASGTAQATNIECRHVGGQFADSGGSPSVTPLSLSNNQYLGQPKSIITAGQYCSSISSATDAGKLAAYRCYANAYWQNAGNFANGSCGRDYNFDWQATNPANFIRKDDFKGRPRNAFITNILNYASDGQSATLEDEETSNVTIQTGANNSTFCKVVRKTQLIFKKVSATKMKVELREGGRMASTDTACIAAANKAQTDEQNELHWMLKPTNILFYLNKVQ